MIARILGLLTTIALIACALGCHASGSGDTECLLQ